MRGFSRVTPAAWLSLRHGSLGAVGNSNLRCSLSSPIERLVINRSIKIPPNVSPRYARPEARLSDRGIGTGSIHHPNWARQGQCSLTAAKAFGSVMGDDGGGTSEHHAPERPRQTERGSVQRAGTDGVLSISSSEGVSGGGKGPKAPGARVVAASSARRMLEHTADGGNGFQGANMVLVSSTVSPAAILSRALNAKAVASGRHPSNQFSGS